MIRRSLLVLAFVLGSAATVSGNAQPFPHLLHLHPGASTTPDTRVSVDIYNKGFMFKEVMVCGKVYTIHSQHWLSIKAPAGTTVYAVSHVAHLRKGDPVVTLASSQRNSKIVLTDF